MLSEKLSTPLQLDLGVGEQRSSYGTRSITAPLLPNTLYPRVCRGVLSPKAIFPARTRREFGAHTDLQPSFCTDRPASATYGCTRQS